MTRRRELLALVAAGISGCVSRVGESPDIYEETDRLYTCSYDATVAGLVDNEGPTECWSSATFTGQARDIVPDGYGGVLVTDDRGLHKYTEHEDVILPDWHYTGISGSSRGITIDIDTDYYVGSWSEDEGFHKVVEDDNGAPQQAWVYRWPNDTGMITAAANTDKEIALALKNGEVHLIQERSGKPERLWRWSAGTGEIMREVLWDGTGNLFVASEDHHLYKLVVPSAGRPELAWSYDAGNMIFGAALTLEGRVYTATNSGEIHCVRDAKDEASCEWVYQHTAYEGTAPTDEYFWDGLAHQVAAYPDSDGDVVYSCAYGTPSVHRISVENGTPECGWSWEGHDDHVREIRVHGEYAGTTPNLWE